MLPESNHVRRLRRPDGEPDGRTRRGLRLGAIVLAAVAALGMLAAGPAVAAESEPGGEVLVQLALAGGSAVDGTPPADPADDPAAPPRTVQLEVRIENGTDRALGTGGVRVFAAAAPLGDGGLLDAWLAGSEGSPGEGAALGSAETRVILPGGSLTAAIEVPVTALDPGVDGLTPVGLGAVYEADGSVVAAGRGVAVWSEGALPTVRVAAVAAITAPGDASGLLDGETLAELTAPTGELTRRLDAVSARSVAVGIDPRLIASIEVLGDDAPASARTWLERLAAMPNETFPLAYADADLALQARLGLPEPLEAAGFRDATAASILVPPTETPTPTETPAETPADAAGDAPAETPEASDSATEPEPSDDDAPSPVEEDGDAADPVAALLAEWPFTRRDLAWPAEGTAIAGDAAFYAAGGLTTTIRSSADVRGGDARASSTVEGAPALVSDARLSDAYRRAASADSETAFRAAESEAAARLAVLAAGGATEPLLAAFDRNAPVSASRMTTLLADLGALPWASATGLAQAAAAPAVERRVHEGDESESRIDLAARMVGAETSVRDFATVLDDHTLLTDPNRRSLLAAFSLGLLDDGAAWGTAASDFLDATAATLDAVHVVPSAELLVISSEVGIRPEIENLLPYPVTVEVSAVPNNGRLIVDGDVEVTIEPESRSAAQIPVAAGVGNGEVRLTVRLTSPTGIEIGAPVVIDANVQADWEGIGAIVLAVAAVAFLGFGIYRSIRRRRGERSDPDDGDATEHPDSELDDPTPAGPEAGGPAEDARG